MITLIPAVIPESTEQLRSVLETVAAFTTQIQVDVVDGKFVPNMSWPYHEGESTTLLREYTGRLSVEVDLMVATPELVIDAYAAAGVKRIVVHLESVTNYADIIRHRDAEGFLLGISINNDTDLSVLYQHLPQADFVQLMGIRHIGFQGQPFDTEVLARIAHVRHTHPDTPISIDGSVNKDTIRELVAVGANRLISGSALINAPSPKDAYDTLLRSALL
ncbi:hypothetical protein KC727_01320 [Candidatus Kaiserbacteria bacterium]|nr:hypothetical protein [Candidatus Kaiserbacteria bacterium]